MTEEGFWVFGYGSLIWKVDFPYERRVIGYVRSMHRRFWQGSHDHRGTEDNPGRVVTLISSDEYKTHWESRDDTYFTADNDGRALAEDHEKCYGVVYKLRESQREQVVAHLDHREKNGYSTAVVDVFRDDFEAGKSAFIQAHVYIGTTDNVAFLGPVPADVLARQIIFSVGPSGRNLDYFLNLCNAVKVISADHADDHLVVLEKEVRRIADEAGVRIDEVDERNLDDLRNLVLTGSAGLLSN